MYLVRTIFNLHNQKQCELSEEYKCRTVINKLTPNCSLGD